MSYELGYVWRGSVPLRRRRLCIASWGPRRVQYALSVPRDGFGFVRCPNGNLIGCASPGDARALVFPPKLKLSRNLQTPRSAEKRKQSTLKFRFVRSSSNQESTHLHFLPRQKRGRLSLHLWQLRPVGRVRRLQPIEVIHKRPLIVLWLEAGRHIGRREVGR